MDKKNILIIIGVFLVCLITVFGITKFMDNQESNKDTPNKETNTSENKNENISQDQEPTIEEPTNENHLEEQESTSNLTIDDPLVKKAYNLINYPMLLVYPDEIALLSKLYNQSSYNKNLLSDNEKLLLAINAYSHDHKFYGIDQYGMVPVNKSELAIYFEDSSFLDRIPNGDLNCGPYLITKESDIYNIAIATGYAAGLPKIETYFVKATKENDYLYITIKFAYITTNTDYTYNTHKTISDNNVIESNISYDNISNLNWSNYDTYKYTFKILDNNTYFENIEFN